MWCGSSCGCAVLFAGACAGACAGVCTCVGACVCDKSVDGMHHVDLGLVRDKV